MSGHAHSDQSRSVPDKDDRVRVVRVREIPNPHVGKVGRVERFYIGVTHSVGVALDGEGDGIFAFRPDELQVIR